VLIRFVSQLTVAAQNDNLILLKKTCGADTATLSFGLSRVTTLHGVVPTRHGRALQYSSLRLD